ncbi:hypothetical protein LCGC14_2053710, partial [marine sediment metagenome]
MAFLRRNTRLAPGTATVPLTSRVQSSSHSPQKT